MNLLVKKTFQVALLSEEGQSILRMKVIVMLIRKVEKEINSRPMKCLGWRTPSEVFLKQKQRLII